MMTNALIPVYLRTNILVIIQMLSKPRYCPPRLGGVARSSQGWLNAKPCRVRGAQCPARRRTRQGAKRRGIIYEKRTTSPSSRVLLLTQEENFMDVDNIYIITIIIFSFSICRCPPMAVNIQIISRLMADTEYDFPRRLCSDQSVVCRVSLRMVTFHFTCVLTTSIY